MKLSTLASALALALGIAAVPAHALTTVDLELALLIDVSGSVDTTEFNLQKQGYVNAFQDATIQASIASGHSLAVTVVYWSGAAEQQQAVGWTLVNSVASANSFASLIGATVRPFSGSTGVGSALNFITPQFATNNFAGTRKVIDVSGDGAENVGANTAAARNAALAAGVDQINGLPILGEVGLEAWYNANVKGGAGAFVLAADSFADFDAAIKQKIGREIVGNVPEPSTYALMGLGLGVMGYLARRRKVIG